MDSIDFDGHHYGFNVKRTKYFKINNKISNLRFKRNKFSHMKFYKLETEKMNKEVKSIKFQKLSISKKINIEILFCLLIQNQFKFSIFLNNFFIFR